MSSTATISDADLMATAKAFGIDATPPPGRPVVPSDADLMATAKAYGIEATPPARKPATVAGPVASAPKTVQNGSFTDVVGSDLSNDASVLGGYDRSGRITYAPNDLYPGSKAKTLVYFKNGAHAEYDDMGIRIGDSPAAAAAAEKAKWKPLTAEVKPGPFGRVAADAEVLRNLAFNVATGVNDATEQNLRGMNAINRNGIADYESASGLDRFKADPLGTIAQKVIGGAVGLVPGVVSVDPAHLDKSLGEGPSYAGSLGGAGMAAANPAANPNRDAVFASKTKELQDAFNQDPVNTVLSFLPFLGVRGPLGEIGDHVAGKIEPAPVGKAVTRVAGTLRGDTGTPAEPAPYTGKEAAPAPGWRGSYVGQEPSPPAPLPSSARSSLGRGGQASEADLQATAKAFGIEATPPASGVSDVSDRSDVSDGVRALPLERPSPVDLDAEEARARAALKASAESRIAESPSAPIMGDQPGQRRLVEDMPTSEIKADPERFQYKIVSGKGGQTGSLSSVAAWDPDYAGVLHVWRDPADGQTYAVNGHNRLALANRLGVDKLDVSYLNADTAAEARSKGALINIAEGQGSALDAAKLFRDNNYTPETLGRQGINLGGEKARQGMAISNLTTPLFNAALRGELPIERATVIGEKLPNPNDQLTLVQMIDKAQKGGKTLTNGQIGELADQIASGPKQTETTTNLFGEDETTRSSAIERAEIADYIKSSLGSEGRAFGNAAKNKERLEKGNNTIDAAEAKSIAEQNLRGREIFDRLKNTPGAVGDILNEAANRLAAGKENPNVVKQDALTKFQDALPGILRGEEPNAGASPSENAGGNRGESGDLFGEEDGVPGSGTAVEHGGRLAELADRADAVAQAAMDKFKANTKGKALSGIDPQDMWNASVYVAAKLAKGTLTAASYAAHMVETFGEWIRPHLDEIWRAAQDRLHTWRGSDQTKLTEEASGKPEASSLESGTLPEPSAPAPLPSSARSSLGRGGEESDVSDKSDSADSVKPLRKRATYARSINLGKLSDDELQQHYVEWAQSVGGNAQEPLTRADVKRQSRALGLTTEALARLPAGWKPSGVHFGVWMDAVRDVSDAAAKARGAAKRAYDADPTPSNKTALVKATALRDAAAHRRSALGREWGQTGQVLKAPSDPFAAAREGDLFRDDGGQSGGATGKKPAGKSRALKRLAAKDPESFVHFTVDDTNAAIDRLNARFGKVKASDVLDCLS